jgi:uncharacterized protein YbaR (Trm112 family)
MSFDAKLLDIICCPVTRQPIDIMPASRLAKLNTLIQEEKIRDRSEDTVAATLEQALVTEDGKLAYPVVDGMPVLLEERSIALSQLDGV